VNARRRAMKYFLTGGAGFIGSHMVDVLIEEGEVTVYDNLSSGKMDYIARHQADDRFRFIKDDLGKLPSLNETMKGHEAVFHFASNPDIAKSMVETDLDIREGTLLTYNVLEAMRLNGVKRILYASGSGIYGDVGLTPTPEDFGPLLPISMYGASKLACEALISAFCHMFDMQGYIFRFANVVGSRQTHGVGYDFINKLRKNPKELAILGDGTQSKSYIHVSDVIDAMLFVYKKSTDRINVFNVATDDYIDVNTIAEVVIEEMDLEDVTLRYAGGDRGWKGDVPVVRFNLDKIHRLGWQAKFNSKEALRKSIREMLGNE
jgi:UDP-glucose 4-epimerase